MEEFDTVRFIPGERLDLIPRLALVDLQGGAVHWSRFLGNLFFAAGLWNEDLMWLLAAWACAIEYAALS